MSYALPQILQGWKSYVTEAFEPSETNSNTQVQSMVRFDIRAVLGTLVVKFSCAIL